MTDFHIDLNVFKTSFSVKDDGELTIPKKDKWQVLPFTSHPDDLSSGNLNSVDKLKVRERLMHIIAGSFLCLVEGKCPVKENQDSFFKNLLQGENVDLEDKGDIDFYVKVLQDLYLTKDGFFKPKGISLVEHNYEENMYANYLFSMIEDKELLKDIVRKCNIDFNVIDRLILESTDFTEKPKYTNYKKIITFLDKPFIDDLTYVLENTDRIKEFFCPLLETYLFLYMTYSLLKLSHFNKGCRDLGPDRLYFGLDDREQVSLSRKACEFKTGYKYIDKISNEIYVYMIVFKIINLNSDGKIYDFIDLRDCIDSGEFNEKQIGSQLQLFYSYFIELGLKKKITAFQEYKDKVDEIDWNDLYSALNAVFELIESYFENTKRSAAQSRVKRKLMFIMSPFVKNRGYSGKAFNINEEQLIMLTKCIIREDSMRLNDLFRQFELRGIFFDEKTKEVVAQYFDRLNVIEKKSDSGDAQYVRRII